MAENPAFFRPLRCSPPALARGCVSLLSAEISALAESVLAAHDIPRNPQPAHITLLSKDEHRQHVSNPKKTPFADIDLSKLYPVGLSNRNGVWFIPVVWNAGNVWRAKNGFAVKDFHVTLSARDEHDIDKSLYTVPRPHPDEGGGVETNGILLPPSLDVDVLDQIYLFSHLRDDDVPRQVLWAEHAIASHPSSERGYLRLADLAYRLQWHKLAMLSYHAAFSRCASEDGARKRRDYYTKKIASCGGHTEFGPLFTEGEVEFITATITSASVRESLVEPWDPTLGLELPEIELSRAIESRIQYHALHPVPAKLPRFFSWVIPFHLAAMSTPRSAEDIALLHATAGITHVITLTSETPLPRSWFPPAGRIRNTFIPVENYYPPTTQQMDRILSLILSEPSHDPSIPGATLVHCGGGKGRAGTVLACYLALFGFTPPHSPSSFNILAPPKQPAKAALATLRHLRAGSVETAKQEQFIAAYISTAWKRHSDALPLIGAGGEISEPTGSPLVVDGNITSPDMVVLVGLQGSGKTSFAALCKLRNQNVVHVSPDAIVAESGGSSAAAKSACESVVGRFRKSPLGTPTAKRKVLLLDRCNPTAAERRAWRDLFTAGGKIVAVWFDYDYELCIARGENRGEHATLTPWRVRSAVAGMAAMMEAPSVQEGFAGVAKVRSFAAARELADSWFGEVALCKFVRTKHLLDLGAATRDDLVIPPQDLQLRYFNQPVTVEEKLDGANLGFSLSRSGRLLVQNRSHYVSSSDQAQFAKLDAWLSAHAPDLRRVLARDEILPERFILYGEWLAATHTVVYDRLPDYFVAFDLYDRLRGVFASPDALRDLLTGSGIAAVPVLYKGVLLGEDMLRAFLERESLFSGTEKVEGVVVRWESGERGKVVRSDFIAGRHWSKGVYRRNGLAREGVMEQQQQEKGEEEEEKGEEKEEVAVSTSDEL